MFNPHCSSPSATSVSAATSRHSSSTPAIVGGVIGGIVAFLIVVIVAVVFRRRYKRYRTASAFNPELMFKQRESFSSVKQTHYSAIMDT
jgi:hypothetical protein